MPRITVLLVTLLIAAVVQAGVVRVPTDQATIQAGIDAASIGDTVLVADGTYTGSGNHDLDIDKILVVQSENGPATTIIDCESNGRAFYIHGGTGVGPTIEGFTMKNGSASAATVHTQAGGAVECWGYSGVFRSCVFLNNTALFGGALYFNPSLYDHGSIPGISQPSVLNCTFVGNDASDSGSVYFQNGIIQTTFSECILYGNTGSYPVAGSETVLQCCDLYGNSPGDWISWIADQQALNGNFSEDPLFCDAAGGNFALPQCSPCVRSNDYCTGLVGGLGIGCDSGCPNSVTWFVATTGNDETGDGSNDNPFATFQKAIDAASDGDIVLVAGGTYTGTGNHDIDINKNVTVRSENGPASTVIDCESNGRAFYVHDGTGVGPTIEGFTIRNGLASAATVHTQAGGAIECWGFSGVIKRCVFQGNVATFGGALYFNPSLYNHGPVPGVSEPSVVNCTFVGNNASDSGSVYFQNGIIQTTFSECILYENTGSYPVAGSETVLQCSDLYGNSPGDWISWIADQGTSNGNFSADPLFCDVAGNSFSLSHCSPCLRTNDYCTGLVGALGVDCYSECQGAAVWYVAVTGSDQTGDGTSGNPFATIQKAVGSSSEGDTVLVGPGDYQERIVFQSASILLTSSDGSGSTFISGPSGGIDFSTGA
ncbi:MAG: DUF1565 domain-containing protein, partial [candidate division Zixibacteria bacterium]|nr:DUF1565 domain-containing protein [candidate division Zixibacteria bacterium]